jgi:hypothetical protein
MVESPSQRYTAILAKVEVRTHKIRKHVDFLYYNHRSHTVVEQDGTVELTSYRRRKRFGKNRVEIRERNVV